MTKNAKLVWLLVLVTCALPCAAQSGNLAENPDQNSRASSYYHFALGHLYAELAGAYGNKGDYLDKAIDSYREALAADPDASFLAEELANLYVQAGRLREAVEDANSILEKNPNDVNARKILGRIYTRLIGDTRENKVNEAMLARAIEQYVKLSELLPDDVDVWLMLGRLHRVAQDSVESETAYKKVLEIEEDNEDALMGLASVYAGLGDNPRAAEMLRRLVAMNPSIGTLTGLAQTYEQQREYDLAAETFRRALELSPDNTNIKRALAENLFLSRKYDESAEFYQQVAAEQEQDFYSRLRLSQIFSRQRDFNKARQFLDEAKNIAPENIEVRYNDISLLESEGRTDEAIILIKEILKGTENSSYNSGERSNRTVFLERLGLMHRNQEQFEEAIEVFNQLQELDPELEARAAAQIADTYRQAKEFDKAAEHINAAYEKFPDDRMINVIRASVMADQGKADKAVAAIKKLVKGGKDLDSYITLAQIYEKTKRYGAMSKVLDEALEISETDDDKVAVLFMRGAMYERMKQHEKAENDFREVLKLSPDNASAMNYLGYMIADRNVRLQEAHDLISKALEYEPHNGAYLDSLGWVYYRMDRLEEAEEYLLRAVEKVSRDPVVHDHLGDVYNKLGNLKKAIEHWRNSLKEWEASSAGEKDPSQVSAIQKKLEGAEVRLARESSSVQSR